MFGIIILITAVLVVGATSLLKSVEFSSKTKNAIAVGVSVVGGAVAAIVENGGFDSFTTAGLMGTILIVYGLATAIYKFVMPKGLDEALENVLVHPKTNPEVHQPGQFSE